MRELCFMKLSRIDVHIEFSWGFLWSKIFSTWMKSDHYTNTRRHISETVEDFEMHLVFRKISYQNCQKNVGV